jgi:hypothetical protein
MKKLLATMLFVLTSNICLAGWTGPQTIQAIYPQANAEEVIIQLPNYDPSHGCNHSNGKYLLLSGHANFKAIYALLLAAHAAGTPVNIHLSTGLCTGSNFSQITLVMSGTLN